MVSFSPATRLGVTEPAANLRQVDPWESRGHTGRHEIRDQGRYDAHPREIKSRAAGSITSSSSTAGGPFVACCKSAVLPLCGTAPVTAGVTAGWIGDDSAWGGGCGSGGFGGLLVATSVVAGSAGFPAPDGWSATAADFCATETGDFSATAASDFSVPEGVGFAGGGWRKESTKAHPPAIQTAIIKTTPAVRTAFWKAVRRHAAAGLSGSAGPLAGGAPAPAFGSEMQRTPPNHIERHTPS